MNTKIDAPKAKKAVNRPTKTVRAVCGALLIAPVILGSILALQLRVPYTIHTRYSTLFHDKIFFLEQAPPSFTPPDRSKAVYPNSQTLTANH